jgi:hypothetical protein
MFRSISQRSIDIQFGKQEFKEIYQNIKCIKLKTQTIIGDSNKRRVFYVHIALEDGRIFGIKPL